MTAPSHPHKPRQTEPSGAQQWSIYWAIVPLMLMVTHIFYLGFFRPDSFQKLITTLWLKGETRKLGREFEAIDCVAGRWAKNGNIMLKFSGYDQQSADLMQMGTIYYRSCYHLYPVRVFTTFEDVPRDLRQVNPPEFNPDKKWLSEHKVSAQVLIEKSKDGPKVTLSPVD